jgi:hypothetical protein
MTIQHIFCITIDFWLHTIKDGGRQRLAAEALKLKLLELVQNGKQVKLDDFAIKTVADALNLDKTTLITAVQSAVFFFKQPKK